MPVLIEKSPLNAISFIQEGYPQRAEINNRYPGQDWEVNTLPAGIQKAQYAYQAQFSDRLEFQFNIADEGVTSVELTLIKRIWTANGPGISVLQTWSVTPTYFANMKVVVDGVELSQGTYHFKISPAEIDGLQPGVYYFRLNVLYDSTGGFSPDSEAHDISEPVRIAWNHPGTILIKARNNSNDFDTIFGNPIYAEFAIRVRGKLHGFVPDSVDTSSTNQRGKRKKLYSRPGDTKTLTIGGGHGVSDWMKSVCNYAMSCDYKEVDGIEITKDDNSQWEQIAIPGYPLGGESMVVRSADPSGRFKSIHRPHIILFTRPARFPYFVHTVGVKEAAGSPETIGSAFHIKNVFDEAKMLQRLTIALIAGGFTGHVALSGKEWQYYNGVGETYAESVTIVLPYFMEVTHDTNISTLPALFDIQAKEIGIVWDKYATASLGSSSSTLLHPGYYTYPVNSIVKTRIFHNNTIEQFASGTDSIVDVAGTVSNIMDAIGISGTALKTFDAEILKPAYDTLSSLNLSGNVLTHIFNTSVFYNGSPAGDAFTLLDNINASGNRMSIADVDNLLSSINGMAYNLGGASITLGTLQTQGQTPPAPPSPGLGVPAKDDLTTAYSWTVTTD